MHIPSGYNILVSVTAAFGSLTYGYAAAILGNTLEKAAFYEYMNLELEGAGAAHTTSIIAWWNTILYVGGFFACMSYTAFGNRYGRKSGIALGATVSVLGAALQAGSVNPAMMIVARLIVGAGMGILLPAVPLYQAEIAPPSNRGLLVGIHASLIGYGSMISGWIGVGFFYTGGNIGWRVPLALQTIFPLVLLIVVWFLPESPRWLYMHDRAEEAKKVLIALHKKSSDPNHLFAQKELFVIKNQIDYENQNRLPVWQALKKRSLQKRFLIGFLSMSCTQCSGLLVVLTYQSTIYQSLGYSAFMAGVFGSIWSVLNGTGNFCGGMLGDYVGRKKLVAISLVILDCMLIVLCTTTYLYSGTDNKAGNTAAAVFTFLMIIVYATGVDCASLVYSSELYPGEYRAIGVSVSLSPVLFWGCIFTGAAGPAFANIGALYYVVFIALTSVMALVVIFFFPDTKGFTLEQMSAVFGDDVVDMYGNIENAKDFIKEDHNIEHADMNKDTPPQTEHIEVEGENKTETV